VRIKNNHTGYAGGLQSSKGMWPSEGDVGGSSRQAVRSWRSKRELMQQQKREQSLDGETSGPCATRTDTNRRWKYCVASRHSHASGLTLGFAATFSSFPNEEKGENTGVRCRFFLRVF
jgi:hypothetical protein